MFFQELLAIIYALFTEASAFPQRMGLFVQRTMFVWISSFLTFFKLRLEGPCDLCLLNIYRCLCGPLPFALSLSWSLHEEVKAWVCASLCLCIDEVYQHGEGWEAYLCSCLYLVPKYSHFSCKLQGCFSMIGLIPLEVSKYDKPAR